MDLYYDSVVNEMLQEINYGIGYCPVSKIIWFRQTKKFFFKYSNIFVCYRKKQKKSFRDYWALNICNNEIYALNHRSKTMIFFL